MGKIKVSLILTAWLLIAIVWLPFVLKLSFWGLNFEAGLMRVWANFDGPNYLIIARTWYDKALIAKGFSNPLPLEYYPAHWPLYPAIIAFFDLFLSGPRAMLAASLLGIALFCSALVDFLNSFGVPKKRILTLGLIGIILPARWLAVKSVGSPEAWFMGFLLFALVAYKEKRYLLAGICGALAQLTKSPAILLFLAVGVYELSQLLHQRIGWRSFLNRIFKLALIPLAILAVFSLYYFRTGDFWAYFHSGDNFHLFWPPFSIFTHGGAWVGSFWLEEVIWLWLIYGLGILRFWRQEKAITPPVVFGVVFFITTLFVSHRDLARYILPILPIALIGWQKVISKREFKIMALVLIIPILLFTWNFLLNNFAPVADWSPYL